MDKAGFICAIGEAGGALVKIGRMAHRIKRLAALQTASPGALVVLAYAPVVGNISRIEKTIHQLPH
jgi:hypothetical protein